MEQNHCTTKTGKWKQLTERDRYKIEAYFQAGLKPQEIAAYIGCSKRTIERERRLGMTAQLKPATKNIKACGDLQVQWVYLADAAQRRHEENAARKGRGLKIDKDHALARHIEHKIKTEKWSPAAVIGELCQRGWSYDVRICVKTLYNYIDQQLFLELTNDDLLYKKNRDKQTENSRHGVAWNNRDGKSIDERPEPVNRREEFGHWEIDLVVGSKGTKPVILTLVERQTRRLYARIQEYHGGQRVRVFGWRRNEACRQMRRGILRASVQQLGAWKQRKRKSDAAQVSSQGNGLQQIEAEGTAADRRLG